MYTGHMKTMNASAFKAECLALFDQVAATGEPIRILKRGKAVAEIVPPTRSHAAFPQRTLRGKGRIVGDVVSPVLPADAWEADGSNLE
jgi:antitoxin (DNA-binding transcriptional repressor) of toxin-antitoxin stability system